MAWDGLLPVPEYLTDASVITAKRLAAAVCQKEGCSAPVTVIITHLLEYELHGSVVYDHFVLQLCDEHATLNEEAMRLLFKVKPATAIWRDKDDDLPPE